MNRFQKTFQRAAHADPFAVDALKVVQPKQLAKTETISAGVASHKVNIGRKITPSEGLHSNQDHEVTRGPISVKCPTSTTVGGGATTFEAPDWATEPRPGVFDLEVMKDGVGIGQLPLEQKATVFGRQAPLCHFVLDHHSVSRQHAAVVFHKNGSFYVVDMGSAHGTFVSNERLRKDSPVEIEPGQSVKFAASTRLYMLRKSTEAAGPGPRDAVTPPVDLPPLPDPADTDSVVAYHTLVNRHGCDSPLNAERLPLKEHACDSQLLVPGSTTETDADEFETRPKKRQRLRSRVSFSDQFGGALAQVVGVSDGADVDRVGPIGVPEGQALTGKYASLVETVIEPLPNRSAVSPKQPPAVSDKLRQYLNMSKGLYGDAPAPSTSEASVAARGDRNPIRPFERIAEPGPLTRVRNEPTFEDDADIFAEDKQIQTLDTIVQPPDSGSRH